MGGENCQAMRSSLALHCVLGGSGGEIGVDAVVMEKIKQDSALALGASGVFFRQHHIHEATGAPDEDHGSGLWTI